MNNLSLHSAQYFSTAHSAVYFLECRDKAGNLYVKVGFSGSPTRRADGIATGLPLPITRLRYVNVSGSRVSVTLEKELHKYLIRWHERGEWFFFSKDDAEGAEYYEFGVKGQLDCWLCRGAWSFVDVDLAARTEVKKENLRKNRAAWAARKKSGRKHQKRGYSSIYAP